MIIDTSQTKVSFKLGPMETSHPTAYEEMHTTDRKWWPWNGYCKKSSISIYNFLCPRLIWRQVISGIHNGKRKPIHTLRKKSVKGTWYDIVEIIQDLQKLGIEQQDIWKYSINSGSDTFFWLDSWNEVGSLASRFPLLFNLDKRKSCFIGPDRWISELSSDGSFAVHDLRFTIEEVTIIPSPNPTIWPHIIPVKIICFVWRACLGRIPTAVALSHRGVQVPSSSCAFCINGIDDVDHLLADCLIVKEIMEWIFVWCGIPPQYFSKVVDIVDFAGNWGRCPKKRNILVAICYGYIWCLWKAWNDKVFNNSFTSVGKLKDNIALLAFGWVKNRGNYKNCNLATWNSSPFNIL